MSLRHPLFGGWEWLIPWDCAKEDKSMQNLLPLILIGLIVYLMFSRAAVAATTHTNLNDLKMGIQLTYPKIAWKR